MNKRQSSVQNLALTALMAALCYIGFTFFKINIPVGEGSTAIHFGNTFCVLAALMLGGVQGGLAGAIGMGIVRSALCDKFSENVYSKILYRFMCRICS